MNGHGSRSRQDRLLRLLKVAGEGPPIANLVTDAGVGLGGGRARAERAQVNVLELLRDLLDDLSLAGRRAREGREVVADVAAPVRHG
jgi:hypothetical protein